MINKTLKLQSNNHLSKFLRFELQFGKVNFGIQHHVSVEIGLETTMSDSPHLVRFGGNKRRRHQILGMHQSRAHA